jgi:tRNA(fMet)-specific endonuclease VapC
MVRYILDTDQFTLYRRFDSAVVARIRDVAVGDLAITAVTVEEQMSGWLSEIRKASSKQSEQARKLSWAYLQLRTTVQIVGRFSILDYTVEAHEKFVELRRQGIRIGTQDLRIASIALLAGSTVVTRNRRDFEQVPGLQIEDWSIKP